MYHRTNVVNVVHPFLLEGDTIAFLMIWIVKYYLVKRILQIILINLCFAG